MQLVVGRIVKAHGIAGEVAVEVRTDDPEHRFAPGSSLDTDPSERGPLVVVRSRWHSGRLLVTLRDVTDRNLAEALRGTVLVADSQSSLAVDDADDYWDHDLVGLRAHTVAGLELGDVCDVLHPPGPPVLVIARPEAGEVLVPFVRELVPTVDLVARRVLIDPPEGLLDL
ncbi:MAG TPA: ribosome maturation factor RimM [Mycobacteriales bacterium]|nr:ribosome maturation factor RimM [Mycobacteriales bacterium]